MNLRWSWDERTRDLFRWVDPEAWDAIRPRPGPAPRPRPARAARGPGRRPGLPAATSAEIDDELPALPRRAPLVPEPARPTARCGSVAYFSPEFGIAEALPQYSGGLGVLAGDHLKAASRPRRAARRHRPLLPPRLLPPAPRRRRLAAGALPRPRPARHGAHARATASRVSVDLAGEPLRRPGLAGRRRADRRCTCSTPTSTSNPPDAARRSPTGSTAATPSTGSARRSCSASAACGPCTRSGIDAAGVPHQRGPRRLPRPRAHPPARADDGLVVRRGHRGGARRRASSPPTRRCRPASTASPAS